MKHPTSQGNRVSPTFWFNLPLTTWKPSTHSCSPNFSSSLLLSQPSILDECGLDAETKETLLTHIRRRLMPQAVKARADIEVSCYGYEGIDAVKTALQAGMNLTNENGQQVKINLITPPQYVLTTQSLDKESGLGMLQQAIDEIEKSIKAQGGGFNVIQAVSTGLDTLVRFRWLGFDG